MENIFHFSSKTKSLTLALLALVAITFSAPTLAQFKWKDSNGRWVYSDQPPPSGVNGQALAAPAPMAKPAAQQSANAEPKASMAANSDDKALATKRKELEASQVAKDKQDLAKKNQANCDLVRTNLKALQSEVRVRVADANGERNFLSEPEKQSRAIAAQKELATNCNG
jgi:uncharacterized iron-regulated membrane protein